MQQPSQYESIALSIAQAEQAEEQWKARKDYLRALLVQLHQAGDAPAKFAAAGKSWTLSDGRKAWTYPAQIGEWEANLKRHKTIAQNDGSATFVMGDPYYTSRKAGQK